MAVAGSHRVTGGLDAVRHGLRALHARGPGGRLIGRAACRRGARALDVGCIATDRTSGHFEGGARA